MLRRTISGRSMLLGELSRGLFQSETHSKPNATQLLSLSPSLMQLVPTFFQIETSPEPRSAWSPSNECCRYTLHWFFIRGGSSINFCAVVFVVEISGVKDLFVTCFAQQVPLLSRQSTASRYCPGWPTRASCHPARRRRTPPHVRAL